MSFSSSCNYSAALQLLLSKRSSIVGCTDETVRSDCAKHMSHRHLCVAGTWVGFFGVHDKTGDTGGPNATRTWKVGLVSSDSGAASATASSKRAAHQRRTHLQKLRGGGGHLPVRCVPLQMSVASESPRPVSGSRGLGGPWRRLNGLNPAEYIETPGAHHNTSMQT